MMKVLIVDDDIGLTQLLQLVFESRGFRVKIAHNGQSALQDLDQELPEVIVLDLTIPDVDGLEVCRQVRTNPRTSNVPVIVLTAKPGEDIRDKALKAGATEYLSKPIRPSQLIQHIREVIAHPNFSATRVLT